MNISGKPQFGNKGKPFTEPAEADMRAMGTVWHLDMLEHDSLTSAQKWVKIITHELNQAFLVLCQLHDKNLCCCALRALAHAVLCNQHLGQKSFRTQMGANHSHAHARNGLFKLRWVRSGVQQRMHCIGERVVLCYHYLLRWACALCAHAVLCGKVTL